MPSPSRDAARGERRDPSEELDFLLDILSERFIRQGYAARNAPNSDTFYADIVERIAANNLEDATVDDLRERARLIEAELDLATKFGFVNLSQLVRVESTLENLRTNSRNKKTIATVLEPFFSTHEADAENLAEVVRSVDQLVSAANSYLRDKELRFSPATGLVIVPEGEPESAGLDAQQLSSGERHLLLLLGTAMLADENRLILIDEPELSLGIRWKRQLISSLLNLTEPSQAQFVIASHSVEVITPYRASAVQLRQ